MERVEGDLCLGKKERGASEISQSNLLIYKMKMRKLKPCGEKWLSYDCTLGKWKSQDQSPDLLTSSPEFFPLHNAAILCEKIWIIHPFLQRGGILILWASKGISLTLTSERDWKRIEIQTFSSGFCTLREDMRESRKFSSIKTTKDSSYKDNFLRSTNKIRPKFIAPTFLKETSH